MDEVKNASGKSHTENEFNSDLRYISDFNKIRRLLSCTRRAVDEYDLISDGDRIAVGLSGRKRFNRASMCSDKSFCFLS